MRCLGTGFLSVLVLFALMVADVYPAHAQAPRRVLLLPLTTDFLKEADARKVEAQIRDEVAASMPRYIVLPRPALDLASMKVTAGCATDGKDCLALIGRTTRASWVVQVSLRGSRKRAKLVVQRVRSQTAVESKYTTELTSVGVGSARALRWHVATALGARPAPLPGRLVLRAVRGQLTGAIILLDQRQVGSAALRQVNPGRHRLEIRRRGYRPFIWAGEVRPAQDTSIIVKMVPRVSSVSSDTTLTETTPRAVEDDGGPVWTWVLGAGAVVAAGTAAVFGVQVLNLESEAERLTLDCNGEGRNSDTCKNGRDRALIANISWGAAGALAVSAVVAYFIESSDGDSSTAKSSPLDDARFGVAPTADGMAASFEVSF